MSTLKIEKFDLKLSEQDEEEPLKALLDRVRRTDGSEVLPSHSLLVTTESAATMRIAEQLLRAAQELDEKRQQLTDNQISRLVDIFLEGETRTDVDLDLQRDNARLRADYIKGTASYTASEIQSFQSGPHPKNPSEPAARWKRERRLFAVAHGNIDLFPAFQFTDGAPNPAIKKVLRALPDTLSAWQTAFWFASGNGWLDGEAPQDALNSLDDVLEAARRLHQPAVG